MKPSSWDKQRGLALPLERAAGQSNQTNNLSENVVGLDVSHHTHVFRGAGRSFFLDILFHRMSDSAISHHLTQLLCPMFQCLDRKRQKKHTVGGLNPQPGVDTPN